MPHAVQLHLGVAFFETHDRFFFFFLFVLLLTAFMESSLNLWASIAPACTAVQREDVGWELHLVAYGVFSAVVSLVIFVLLVVFSGFCCS